MTILKLSNLKIKYLLIYTQVNNILLFHNNDLTFNYNISSGGQIVYQYRTINTRDRPYTWLLHRYKIKKEK